MGTSSTFIQGNTPYLSGQLFLLEGYTLKKKEIRSFGRSGIIYPAKQRHILGECNLHFVKTKLGVPLISYKG